MLPRGKYLCLQDCRNGPLTKGKIYIIYQTKQGMYTIEFYDTWGNRPGPLNDFWFKNHFKKICIEVNKKIKIL